MAERGVVDAAVLSATDAGGGLALCADLFGDRFVDRASLLAIALCNLTRMETGEVRKQYENITYSVGPLMEALDAERLALAAAAGVRVRSLHEHFRLSFGAEGETMGEMARSLAAELGVPAPLHEAGVRLFSARYGRNFAAENAILPALGDLRRLLGRG